MISVGVGLFFALWALAMLSKLWADYQDNAPAAYIAVSLALFAISLTFYLGAATFVWAAVTRLRGWRLG